MEEILYYEIGSLIKKARNLRGLTQEELSKSIHLTRASVANIERGIQKVSIYTLYQIADILNVAPKSLLPDIEVLKNSKSDLYINYDLLKNQLSSDELNWVKQLKENTEYKEGMNNENEKKD